MSTEGATVYVTHFPCINCTKALIQAGIKNIYYREDYKNHPYAIELLDKNNINYELIDTDTETVKAYFEAL